MNKEYLEKIILIMSLGLSEAIKKELITYEDARSLLFLPIWDTLDDLGVNEDILDIIAVGTDVVEYNEDQDYHKAKELNMNLNQLTQEALKSRKEILGIELFWLTPLLQNLRNSDFNFVKGKYRSSLFFPRKNKDEYQQIRYFDLADFLEHTDLFNVQIGIAPNNKLTEISVSNEARVGLNEQV
ncbi:MAG: DUF3969 family protein [Gammaproteobacteria bacterium]|nr:DUF3969 family protein [Gammaproteobacteria bacterium]